MSKLILDISQEIDQCKVRIGEIEYQIQELQRSCAHVYKIMQQYPYSDIDGIVAFSITCVCTKCNKKIVFKKDTVPRCPHCAVVDLDLMTDFLNQIEPDLYERLSIEHSLACIRSVYKCKLCNRHYFIMYADD